MKKIIIIGVLLLNGNMGFSMEKHGFKIHSKCQGFVLDIFEQYGLLVLAKRRTSIMVQEKPIFSVTTSPINIPQKKSKYVQLQEAAYQRKKVLNTGEVKLVFEGKTSNSGGYLFTVNEVNPKMTYVYRKKLQERPALIHTFSFSSDCKFLQYKVQKVPDSIMVYPSSIEDRGFYISADSTCTFNEPTSEGGDTLTAYLGLHPHGSKYVILKHPSYYRGLCALAKRANN